MLYSLYKNLLLCVREKNSSCFDIYWIIDSWNNNETIDEYQKIEVAMETKRSRWPYFFKTYFV